MILETMLDGTRPSVTGSKETRILNHARISLYPPPPYLASLLPSFLHRRGGGAGGGIPERE